MSALFRNEHLSVSRLKLYEQCALAFYFRYVNKGPVEPRGVAGAFGTVLHAALEQTFVWIVNEEYDGAFPLDLCLRFYREAWKESELVGVALYQEGLDLLRTYARSHPVTTHWNILAVEKEFNLEVGGGMGEGFVVNGFLDRVDKLADDWIAIVDYKSNRMLFYKDELETDLQMSIYGLVARAYWPWAKRISFVFHMLRHDCHQGTVRSQAQIDDAAGYVVALGRRTEDPNQPWTAKLNANCCYCDSRRRCATYAEAVEGRHEVARVDRSDFAEVCAAREKLHKIAKAAYARKAELDDVIKARLAQEGEFTLGGFHYRTIDQTSVSYPLERLPTLERAFAELGVSAREVRQRVLAIDKEKVEELRVEATSRAASREAALMLKASIEAAQEHTVTPKLDSHAVKTAKTAEAAR
jgi:hypothetical protein